MDRRDVLRVAALSVLGGCLSNAPADTGPRNPPHETTNPATDPETDVRVEEFDAAAADDGRLRVIGTVGNSRGRSVESTVVVTATVDGQTYEAETVVVVPAGGTSEFATTLDVEYEAFAAGGSLRVEVEE